jgi:hypothetical protein
LNCEEVERIVRESLLSFTKVEPFDLGCKVILPQLDIKNDFLAIYLVESKKGLELTDLGRTMEALSAESLEIDTEKRSTIFSAILSQNGVVLRGDELVVDVPREDIATLRNRLVLFSSAIQAINAMLHLKQPRMSLDFRGVVRQYLFDNEIQHEYLPSIEVPRIGPTHFDFVLVARRPVAMDALHAMDTYHASGLIDRTYVKFQYMGRMPTFPLRAVVFNDESSVSQAREFSILDEVLDTPPIPWSERTARFSDLIVYRDGNARRRQGR